MLVAGCGWERLSMGWEKSSLQERQVQTLRLLFLCLMVTQNLQVCIKYRIKSAFAAGHCCFPTVWDLPCMQLRDQITGCSAFEICSLFQSLHLVMPSTAKDSILGTRVHKTPGIQLFTVPWRLIWSNLSLFVSVAKTLKAHPG